MSTGCVAALKAVARCRSILLLLFVGARGLGVPPPLPLPLPLLPLLLLPLPLLLLLLLPPAVGMDMVVQSPRWPSRSRLRS